MQINLYDKVKLTEERKAVIVDIYEQGKAYEADIEDKGDYITDTILQENILQVL